MARTTKKKGGLTRKKARETTKSRSRRPKTRLRLVKSEPPNPTLDAPEPIEAHHSTAILPDVP